MGRAARDSWRGVPQVARQGMKWAALLGALGCLGYASVWRFPPWLEMRLGYGEEAEEQILRLAWLSQEVGRYRQADGWRVRRTERALWHLHPDLDLPDSYFGERESSLDRLEAYYQEPLEEVPDIYLFPSQESYEEFHGIEDPSFFCREQGRAFSSMGIWAEVYDIEPEHEPGHLLTRKAYGYENRFLQEGISGYVSHRGALGVHKSAMALRESAPPLRELQLSFLDPPSAEFPWTWCFGYPMAASFVTYAHDRYGQKTFHRYARALDSYSRAYERPRIHNLPRNEPEALLGTTHAELERDWTRYLQALEPRPSPDGSHDLTATLEGYWQVFGTEYRVPILSNAAPPEWVGEGDALLCHVDREDIPHNEILVELPLGPVSPLLGECRVTGEDRLVECEVDLHPDDGVDKTVRAVIGEHGQLLGIAQPHDKRVGRYLLRDRRDGPEGNGQYVTPLGGGRQRMIPGLPPEQFSWWLEVDLLGENWIVRSPSHTAVVDPNGGVIFGPWPWTWGLIDDVTHLGEGWLVKVVGEQHCSRQLEVMYAIDGRHHPLGNLPVCSILGPMRGCQVAVTVAGQDGEMDVWVVNAITGEERFAATIPSHAVAWKLAGPFLFYTERSLGTVDLPTLGWIPLLTPVEQETGA